MTTQPIDKELLALQRNVGYKADSNKKRVDEDLERLARQSGIPIGGYLPGKTKTFEPSELTVDYSFDSSNELPVEAQQQNINNVATTPISVYSQLSPAMIDVLRKAVKEECGGIPEIDDPLLEEILERHVKHKPHKAKAKHEKHDVLMALQQMYPYYKTTYPVFGYGYYGNPIPCDHDKDDPKSTATTTTANINATPSNIGADIDSQSSASESISEADDIDWTSTATGLVVITKNGTEYQLNREQSAEFKQEAMSLPSDSDELVQLMKKFSADDIVEDVREDVLVGITSSPNTPTINTPISNATALITSLNGLGKLSIADKCLINHLRAFIDRNSY